MIKDREAVGAIGLSFELDCDFIFIQTDDVRLISRLSSLRPHAYLIVFTDNPKVKGAVAINFGVYCYPTSENTTPRRFIEAHGSNYGLSPVEKVRILRL